MTSVHLSRIKMKQDGDGSQVGELIVKLASSNWIRSESRGRNSNKLKQISV